MHRYDLVLVTRLIYVRHGESNSTVNRVIGGHRTCSGLSELGHRQAAALRDRWLADADVMPDLLISSQFVRARETAGYISAAFGDMAVQVDPEFGEHDPGEACDGMTMADFVERYGTDGWSDDPFGVTFPGGETLAAFQFRIGRAVRRLTDDHPDATIIVTCHGGVIDAVFRQAVRAAPTGGFQINTANTSITELWRQASGGWLLRRFGDAAHLAGLPASTNGQPASSNAPTGGRA